MVERVPAGEMRVSDTTRREVADRLSAAHEEGLLDLSEFDERVAEVWRARTRDDIARVTADLPRPRRRRNHGIVFADSAGGITMKVLTIIWASLSAVTITVWGIVALSVDDPISPWWLWTVAPPAAVLLVLYIAGIGRRPRGG